MFRDTEDEAPCTFYERQVSLGLIRFQLSAGQWESFVRPPLSEFPLISGKVLLIVIAWCKLVGGGCDKQSVFNLLNPGSQSRLLRITDFLGGAIMTSKDANERYEALASSINSLKEVVTIVTGVTIATAIVTFLTGGTFSVIKPIVEIEITSAVFFLLMITNLIRFYHGNMRHLDDAYQTHVSPGGKGGIPKRHLGLDFVVVYAESVLFAIMSFFLSKPAEFIGIFTVLLFLDVIWVLASSQFPLKRQAFTYQKYWALNNVVTVIVLLLATAYAVGLAAEIYVWLVAVVLWANTIVDFRINWEFYFPNVTVTAESA